MCKGPKKEVKGNREYIDLRQETKKFGLFTKKKTTKSVSHTTVED